MSPEWQIFLLLQCQVKEDWQHQLKFLVCLTQEHQTKDGTSLEFLLDLLSTLKSEKGGASVVNVIKKSGLESRLMEFFPSSNQQEDNFARMFTARDLSEVVTFRKAQAGQNAKKVGGGLISVLSFEDLGKRMF